MAHPLSLPYWCIEEAESLLRRVAVIPAPSLQEDGTIRAILSGKYYERSEESIREVLGL